MFDYYKRWIDLRKHHPVLQIPDKENFRISYEGKVLLLERWQNQNHLFAVLNFEAKKKIVRAPNSLPFNLHKLIDSSDPRWAGPGISCPASVEGGAEITISPQTVVAYSNETGMTAPETNADDTNG